MENEKRDILLTDFWKLLAIVTVVMIHVGGKKMAVIDPKSFLWGLNFQLDQVWRFSVPLFVALSGFGLAKKYQFAEKISWKEFLTRRVLKLLPWFVGWSAFIFTFLNYFHLDYGRYGGVPLWKIIFLGKADYHLYFVPMIFQAYLLFPFLRRLVKWGGGWVVVAAFLFQAGLYFSIGKVTEIVGNSGGFYPDQEQYIQFLSWIFYFVLGIWLATGVKMGAIKYKKIFFLASLIATITLLYVVIWEAKKNFLSGIDVIVAARFTRVSVLFYATALIFFLVGNEWNFDWFKPIVARMAPFGKLSFLVYLNHTIFIYVLFDLYKFGRNWPYLLVVAIVITASFLLAAIMSLAASYISKINDQKFSITKLP